MKKSDIKITEECQFLNMTKEEVEKIMDAVAPNLKDFGKEVAPGMFQFKTGRMMVYTGTKGRENIMKAVEEHAKNLTK